ncbi:flagellar biosynthetic protein FliR [Ancylobacter sp. IITR112]|uniref:flagellar biosynthetic protein FliR n=1 Tax=Ancylobacter sp. IITR112 TaxID=3138073 RepID=UPI00352BA936
MNGPAEAPLVAAFLIFCRIGACFMLMPAFSSSRLPAKIRLFLALGISYAFTPLLGDEIARTVAGLSQMQLLLAIGGELATGGVIGLLARIFFLALQTLMTAAAQTVGLATPSSMMAEDDGQMPEIATLMGLSAIRAAVRHGTALGDFAGAGRILCPPAAGRHLPGRGLARPRR